MTLERVWWPFWSILSLMALLAPAPVFAAEVLLDEPVRVGDVIAFPSRSDRTQYYYAPVKARLASHETTGAPMFSFLRWVQNLGSAGGEADIEEGAGGGLVHAVVTLGLTEDELEQAREDLSRFDPEATLRGPIVYNRGEFALVTSFQQDEDSELTERLVGVGDAPILEGGKAAISIFLTRLGSQILWESFNTPTPDISFLFKMEMSGYRSPKQAIVEANFDDIYNHRRFEEEFGMSGSLDAAAAVPLEGVLIGAGANVGGMLQAEIDKSFEELRQSGAIRIEQVGEDEDMNKIVQQTFADLREMIFKPAPRIARPDSRLPIGGGAGGVGTRGDDAEALKQAGQAAGPILQTAGGGSNGQATSKPEKEKKKAPAQSRPAQGCSGYVQPQSGVATRSAGLVSVHAEVGFKLCYSTKYTMKRKRHTGTYRVNLNKYTATNLLVPFAENIGDLRRYLEDPTVFRRVNLDDPLYKQREIAAVVSGLQLEDFGAYVNSVAVQLRKHHEEGDQTLDEVRIDRKTFNRTANEFKLLYGWKGDDDRDRWLDYEWRAQWSFAGGNRLETPWTPGSFSVIPLEPPFERRSIRLEGDPSYLEDVPVRSITVRIHYDTGGSERTEQVTLRADKGDLSRLVDLVFPEGQLEYDYEISWRLRGNKTVTTGRQTTTEDVLYIDELPEA